MADDKDDAVFHEGMQCFATELRYDFKKRQGILLMEDCSCTDMSGCIKVFKSIDPNVIAIQTIAGKRKDTCYVLINGKWEARISPETRP